jgi:hypothetical protein
MTFDDHWADTQTRFRLWAAQLGFIDEIEPDNDPEEGFRFVLDNSTTDSAAKMCGEIVLDCKLEAGQSLIMRNLLVYFIAVLGGQIVVRMPRHSLYFCHLDPGKAKPMQRDSQHRDKEKLWDKKVDMFEEIVQDMFEDKLSECRRAQIRRVK